MSAISSRFVGRVPGRCLGQRSTRLSADCTASLIVPARIRPAAWPEVAVRQYSGGSSVSASATMSISQSGHQHPA